MKSLFLSIAVLLMFGAFAQQNPCPACPPVNAAPAKKTVKYKVAAKKPVYTTFAKYGAWSPVQKPALRNIVYQYVDTVNKNAENFFPTTGNVGIGTNAPQSALEIKRNAGDGLSKNFLLQLSNVWSSKGLNEPTIMFSNGDLNPANTSYWTLGARVSGNEVDKEPVAFKIGFKAPNETDEHEFFSIDSYQGRVKIGNVGTNYDGYKLYVEEGILTEKVKVAVKNSEDWFDHVFNEDYRLMPLTDLEKYIGTNKHLPDMPTTNEVMTKGLDLGKNQGLLLKKVEELTLYLIELKKDLEQTKKELAELKK
ncbi:MAG: hypothetical protein ACOVO1_06915 [Chitinophagaceae bacterium]